MTMDIITTAEPPSIHAGSPAELPVAGGSPSNTQITPLDLVEGPKVRTKLRQYSILLALYVTLPALVFNQVYLAKHIL